MSRARKPGPGKQKPEQLKKSPCKSLPEEFARDAVAHEKAALGDRVEMRFRVRLRRPVAEALTAWAVREETNLVNLVAEILEAAVTKGKA